MASPTRVTDARMPLAPLAFALLTAFPLSAGAVDLAMVRSSDLAPYLSLQEAFTAAAGPSLDLSLGDPQVAGDLAGALRGASVVVAVGQDAAAAVKAARPAARVVYALVPRPADPAATVIPAVASPVRQLAVFKRAVPTLRHVGLIYGPTQPKALVADCVAAAAQSGVTLHAHAVSTAEEAVRVARTLLHFVDGLWLLPDPTALTAETYRIYVQAALAAKVPILGFSEGMARTGALVSVEVSSVEMGRCAALAAKHLRDGFPANPAALQGRVLLNSRVAALLDVPLSASLREEAHRVFE